MGMWSRLRRTLRGGKHNAEIEEELRFHLQMDAAGGYEPRQTRLRLGNLTRIQEDTRSMGIVEWLDSALGDARYALRQVRKTPALILAVVLSLAVGVGANTAIFSLVDAALLKPLPVRDPGALRIVEWTHDGFPAGVSNINGDFRRIAGNRHQGSSVSADLYRRLARAQQSFASLAGIADAENVAIAYGPTPAEQVSLQYVSSNFFQTLGIMPPVGRAFHESEDRVGQEPVVVVSHRFWASRLGADPGALDRVARINNMSARIVGIAPPGFFGMVAGQWTDIYAPLAAKTVFQPRPGPVGEDDSDWWVRQVARLQPSVSEAAAIAQFGNVFRVLAARSDSPKLPEIVTMPGARGFGSINPRDTRALWILMLLMGVLLLIVCANVANLLLARSVSRQRESAVRLALGAARTRLFRQHVIESGVMAFFGGGAGLALGYVFARSIHLLFQTGRDQSAAFDLHIDLRILAYTGALSVFTALLFGVAPAVRAARSGVGEALRTQSRSVMGGAMRLPRVLVSIQIALCLSALVAAGLLGRTLSNLKQTAVGFNSQNLAYASLYPRRAGYSPERTAAFIDRVREELSRLPGIVRVSPIGFRPLASMGNNGAINFTGRPWNEGFRANLNSASEGLFETLGLPLIAGRYFTRADMQPNSGVVIVDEIFARRFFPNENPIGRRFGFGVRETPNRLEIIGVVGNSRYNDLRNDLYPTLYEPYRPGGSVHFAIRASTDSSRLSETVRKVVASIDPAVPLTEFRTQTLLIDRFLRTERLLAFLSAAFGLIALALAAIGLAGLLAYAVARRTSEIGVRMALGASAADVVRMVLGDSLGMVGAGILLGLPCAYSIAMLLRATLFRLEPLDPWTVSLSFVALLAVALLAAAIPARRAARIDPMASLREE